MRVTILTEDKHLAYEEFVKSHPAALIYYSIKFKTFLEKQTNSEALYLIAIDENDEIQGVLPIMVKDGNIGKILNSLSYYGSNGGILSKKDAAKNLLIDKYIELVNSGQYIAATLISNPLDLDYPYDRIINDEIDVRVGQLTNICCNINSLDELMIRFDSKTRNMIRKAIKSDVIVNIENNQFDFLRDTHFDNMKSIGGLAKESSFFQNVLDTFEAGIDYNVFVARINEVPVAATFVFYYGKVVEYYTPVIVKEYRSLQPLSLVISTAMLNASRAGFEWWNWGGTWKSQAGVYDFKSKWGTEDKEYVYYVSILNKELYFHPKDELLKQYSGFYVLPFSSLKS